MPWPPDPLPTPLSPRLLSGIAMRGAGVLQATTAAPAAPPAPDAPSATEDGDGTCELYLLGMVISCGVLVVVLLLLFGMWVLTPRKPPASPASIGDRRMSADRLEQRRMSAEHRVRRAVSAPGREAETQTGDACGGGVAVCTQTDPWQPPPARAASRKRLRRGKRGGASAGGGGSGDASERLDDMLSDELLQDLFEVLSDSRGGGSGVLDSASDGDDGTTASSSVGRPPTLPVILAALPHLTRVQILQLHDVLKRDYLPTPAVVVSTAAQTPPHMYPIPLPDRSVGAGTGGGLELPSGSGSGYGDQSWGAPVGLPQPLGGALNCSSSTLQFAHTAPAAPDTTASHGPSSASRGASARGTGRTAVLSAAQRLDAVERNAMHGRLPRAANPPPRRTARLAGGVEGGVVPPRPPSLLPTTPSSAASAPTPTPGPESARSSNPFADTIPVASRGGSPWVNRHAHADASAVGHPLRHPLLPADALLFPSPTRAGGGGSGGGDAAGGATAAPAGGDGAGGRQPHFRYVSIAQRVRGEAGGGVAPASPPTPPAPDPPSASDSPGTTATDGAAGLLLQDIECALHAANASAPRGAPPWGGSGGGGIVPSLPPHSVSVSLPQQLSPSPAAGGGWGGPLLPVTPPRLPEAVSVTPASAATTTAQDAATRSTRAAMLDFALRMAAGRDRDPERGRGRDGDGEWNLDGIQSRSSTMSVEAASAAHPHLLLQPATTTTTMTTPPRRRRLGGHNDVAHDTGDTAVTAQRLIADRSLLSLTTPSMSHATSSRHPAAPAAARSDSRLSSSADASFGAGRAISLDGSRMVRTPVVRGLESLHEAKNVEL